MNSLDPYGLEYGDWEDPETHDYCTGCDMCAPWEGRPYRQIRIARIVEVNRRRAAESGAATPAETGREDRAYWNERYAG